jgi:hypothetical protein
MIEMKFIWVHTAILVGAAIFVRVKLGLLASPRAHQDRGMRGGASLGNGCSDARAGVEGWGHVLHWKLMAGSHKFPGRSGGTCINEAALIATGFEYKPISSADQMPECFSRPICRLAMILNDNARDDERQRLLPYVTRLACADNPDVERKRASYINRRTFYGLIAPRFDAGLRMLDRAIEMGRRSDVLPPEQVKAVPSAAAAKPPREASGHNFTVRCKRRFRSMSTAFEGEI